MRRKSRYKPIRERFLEELKILDEQIAEKQAELEELEIHRKEFKTVIDALPVPLPQKGNDGENTGKAKKLA